MQFIRKKDIIIVICITVVCVIGLIAVNFSDKGSKAEIIIDGKVVKTVDLSVDETLTYDHFVINIKDNSIAVIESDCKDKICVHTGYISKPSQSIVCVPNRLVIKIEGKSDSDLVVG